MRPAAEATFVVADAGQGRGFGTILMAQLAGRALDVGIERFTAKTLARNHRMLPLFQQCGYRITTRMAGGVLDVEIDLLRTRLTLPAEPM